MFGFLDWLVDFLSKVGMIVLNFIDSLLNLGLILQQAVTIPPLIVGFMPGLIGASVTAVFSIGLIKLLLGWGNT